MPDLKETKAQRVERLKRAKNPWDHLDEIRQFAAKGFDSIPPEWLGTYFRPWGIYTQGDGIGVIGGKNGEGKAVPFFMVRIRIPNGLLTSEQARAIADLSDNFGNGVADITVRQNVQLHWIRVENLPELLERLWSVGLRTTGACGDVTRNITGCPLAGIHSHEIADVSPLVLALDKELAGNPDFYNLPRKFNISFTATRRNSLGAAPSGSEGAGFDVSSSSSGHRSLVAGHPSAIGFSLRIAGGLSTEPHLAVKLNAFIRWEQVVPVARAIAEVFRESEVLRQSRDRARMKFLFLQHGWIADSFLAAIESKLGYKLDPAAPEQLPASIHRDHLGVIPQKQPGLFTIGANVIRGRITPAQIRVAADLAEHHGDGHLRATPMQNLLLINIPESRVTSVVQELTANGLPVETNAFVRGTVACTGSEFCKLALTETKSYARWPTEQLEDRFPGYQEDIKLHITGCPNSCGQHWIADIGIEGKKIKHDGKMVDAYYFCLGGALGEHAGISRPVGFRTPADLVPEAVERLLRTYLAERTAGENLRAYFARHSNEELRAAL